MLWKQQVNNCSSGFAMYLADLLNSFAHLEHVHKGVFLWRYTNSFTEVMVRM